MNSFSQHEQRCLAAGSNAPARALVHSPIKRGGSLALVQPPCACQPFFIGAFFLVAPVFCAAQPLKSRTALYSHEEFTFVRSSLSA